MTDRAPSGGFSPGLPGGDATAFGDVFWSAVAAQRTGDNVMAGRALRDRLYDERIDAVERATGTRLFHPFRTPPNDDDYREWDQDRASVTWIDEIVERRFHRELDRLAQQFPDKADVIRAGVTVRNEAYERARGDASRLRDDMTRSPLTVTVPGLGIPLNPAALAGSLWGSLHDPFNAAAMLLGPQGSAARSILWNAGRQGAFSAASQAALEPFVQSWRAEAGLEHGLSDALRNILFAGVMGGGIDAAGRSAGRLVLGRPLSGVPADSPAGSRPAGTEAPAEPDTLGGRRAEGVSPSKTGDALDAAVARLPEDHVVRRAAGGDAEALLAISARSDDPAVRAARQQVDLELAQHPAIGADIAEAEALSRLAAHIRHAGDPALEPPPGAPIATPRGAAAASAAPADLKTALGSGDLAILDQVRVLREFPDLAELVPVTTQGLRDIHALARLSEPGLALVEARVLPPEWAAIVADAAPPARHADLIERVAALAPRDVAQVRRLVAEMMQAATSPEGQRGLLVGGADTPAAGRPALPGGRGPMFALPSGFGLIKAGEYPGIDGLLARMKRAGLRSGRSREEAVPVSAIRPLQSPSDIEPDRLQSYMAAPPPRDVNVSEDRGIWLYRDGDVYYTGDGHHRVEAARRRGDATIDARVRDIVDNSGGPKFSLAEPTRGGKPIAAPEQLQSAVAELARTHDLAPIRAELQRIAERLPKPYGTRLARSLTHHGAEVHGLADPETQLVWVALSADDPVQVLRHEEVHALRNLDLFTAAEWRTLEAAIDRHGLLAAYDIEARYGELYRERFGKDGPDVVEAMLREEAIAEMVADYGRGRRFGGKVDKLLEIWHRLVDAVRQALGLHGITRIDDVMAAIESGEIGRRPTLEDQIAELNALLEKAQNRLRAIEFDDPAGDGAAAQVEMLKPVADRIAPSGRLAEGVSDGANMKLAQGVSPGVQVSRLIELPGEVEISGTPLFALRAFHGTPHDFSPEPGAPAGRFRLDRIGTGEGAQAFGHGLYFAENERVARSYRDALASGTIDGKPFDERTPAHWAAFAIYEAGGDRSAARAALTDQIERMRRSYEDGMAQIVMRGRGMIERGEAVPEYKDAAGRLYEVRLDVEPEQLLDWDKPLKDQPARRAFPDELHGLAGGEAYKKMSERLMPALPPDPPGTPRGWGFVQRGDEGQPALTAALRDAGILGIRYKDAGSRGDADAPTYNYVMFDDSKITIVARDGEPVWHQELRADLDNAAADADAGKLVGACKFA